MLWCDAACRSKLQRALTDLSMFCSTDPHRIMLQHVTDCTPWRDVAGCGCMLPCYSSRMWCVLQCAHFIRGTCILDTGMGDM